LALALIRDSKGSLVMAQGEDISHLKIGSEVYLHQAAGIFYFTVKSHLQVVRAAMQKLWHKDPGPSEKQPSSDSNR
jgi:hypothetical protein